MRNSIITTIVLAILVMAFIGCNDKPVEIVWTSFTDSYDTLDQKAFDVCSEVQEHGVMYKLFYSTDTLKFNDTTIVLFYNSYCSIELQIEVTAKDTTKIFYNNLSFYVMESSDKYDEYGHVDAYSNGNDTIIPSDDQKGIKEFDPVYTHLLDRVLAEYEQEPESSKVLWQPFYGEIKLMVGDPIKRTVIQERRDSTTARAQRVVDRLVEVYGLDTTDHQYDEEFDSLIQPLLNSQISILLDEEVEACMQRYMSNQAEIEHMLHDSTDTRPDVEKFLDYLDAKYCLDFNELDLEKIELQWYPQLLES